MLLFNDDFSGQSGADPLWVTVLGTWSRSDNVMAGTISSPNTYGFAYTSGNWTDYSIQGQIRFPAGAIGGGLGGRVNPATGPH